MLFFYLIAFLLRFLVISLSIFFARSVTYFYTLLLLLIDSLRTYSKMLANFLFTLYFSVLLCWISSSIGHVFIYTPSLLIIRLEFTKKYLVNVFTFENLLFSACFRSLWMAFVCSLLLSVKLQCLHFYDVSKKPSLALSFSVLLCQATLFRQSHICICSFLFRLLSSNLRKNTSQVLVFSYCYSWVFLSISFVFLSIVSRFLCNFLDVMQFSRCNLLLHIFSDFFVSLRRPFNHIFVYALSSSPRLPRTHLKLFCKTDFASLFGNFFASF